MADKIVLNNATGIPVRYVDNGDETWSPQVSTSGGSIPPVAARAGVTLSGSIGASSGEIIPAGTFDGEVTLQNTHASQTLSISFNTPALTTDFTIAAGAALTLRFGPTNALYGIGSGAATTFSAIGA